MAVYLRRIAIALVGMAALIYAGDYLAVRYRIATGREPYGTVTVRSFYIVPQKNGKPEFYFFPPEDQTCVNAIFPHLGYKPCWYLRRHTQNPINM